MAQQLPPKSQTLSSIMTHQNWISSSPAAAAQSPPSTWVVDDFADFTSSRRHAHRRSANDLVAFLPMLVDDSPPNSSPTAVSAVSTAAVGDGFDGIDDEQLMSMFADEMGMRGSVDNADDSSTPSDHNSNDFDGHDHRLLQKPKEEVFHDSIPVGATNLSDSVAVSGDTIADPKRIKRILANRQSARRSRVRKLQYISELERSVTTLQTEVSTLSPRVAFLDHQRLILNVDNSALKQRIAALIQDKIFKDAHQEAMKKEIERLRQVYHEQNFKLKAGTVEPMETLPTTTTNPEDENHRSKEN